MNDWLVPKYTAQEQTTMKERYRILSMLRAFVSDEGFTDSDGDKVFPTVVEIAGIYRAIELIEMEEQ